MNKIEDYAANDWRTLTKEEWEYLFQHYRQAKACIGRTNGSIIFPDNYVIPSEINMYADYAENLLSIPKWKTIESAGAIFLPVVGERVGTSFYQSSALYWSSSYDNYDYNAYFVDICWGSSDIYSLHVELGVRLVQDYPKPSTNNNTTDTTSVTPDVSVVPDTIGWNIPAEVLTVAQARDIASNLESEATSNTKYYIMGWVKKLHSKYVDGITNYGNASFYIEDVKGANSSDDFLAYQVYGPNGDKLTSTDQVAVGDFVVIYGQITNYNGTYETVGKGAAYIWKSTNALIDNNGSDEEPDVVEEEEMLNETLLTQTSFDKFTIENVYGDRTWSFSSKYGAQMSGFNNKTEENDDWFISPAMDLTRKSSATLTFNHAFGPKGSVPSTDETKAQYTVWVSNDYSDDVFAATWTQLEGMTYGTTGWQFVSSGEVAIPAANLRANCRIAWRYTCTTVSATWEIKEVVVKSEKR